MHRTETAPAPPAESPVYSRTNPFVAELIQHERLTKEGSLKDTRHFVVNIAGSGLSYTPGDSLGAFGANSPAVVEELLSLLGFEAESTVKDPKGNPTTLFQAL